MTLEEARQMAKKTRSATLMGYDPNAQVDKNREMPTLKEFINTRYLPHIKTYKRSWNLDKTIIEQKILPRWGNARVSEITRQDIQDFQVNFISAGYKPGTVNRRMALVKYIFSLAEKWEVIDKSPARGVAMMPDNNKIERYLTPAETSRLLHELQNCKSTIVPDVIEFLILTGARKGEALNAKWQDVDSDHALWTVPLSKSGKPRYIPLSKAALNVIEKSQGNNSDYIFPSPKSDKPLKDFYRTWDKIRKKAGIPDVRIHDLRHNFASILVNHGRSLYEVQKLLGHANISTTQRYAHLSQDTLKEATEIVSLSIESDSDVKGK